MKAPLVALVLLTAGSAVADTLDYPNAVTRVTIGSHTIVVQADGAKRDKDGDDVVSGEILSGGKKIEWTISPAPGRGDTYTFVISGGRGQSKTYTGVFRGGTLQLADDEIVSIRIKG